MSALQQAEKYFAAWNNHDTDAITALFAPGGSYSDPNVPEGVSGPHLAGYAGAIIAAFSDLEFEIVKEFACGEGAMVAEWLMKGTHDGEMRGLPLTERRVVNCSQGSPLSASVMRPEAATMRLLYCQMLRNGAPGARWRRRLNN